jgi:hypothetical protein
MSSKLVRLLVCVVFLLVAADCGAPANDPTMVGPEDIDENASLLEPEPQLQGVEVPGTVHADTLSPPPEPTATELPTPTALASCPLSDGYDWSYIYGGEKHQTVNQVILAEDDGFIVLGNSVLMNIDPQGQIVWQVLVDDFLFDGAAIFPSVYGYFVVAGGHGAAAFTEGGELVWQVDVREGVQTYSDTPDGGFALLGYNRVIQYDSEHQIVWQASFEPPGEPFVAATADGSFVFAYTITYTDTSVYYQPTFTDIEVIKIGSDGVRAWQKTYGKTEGLEFVDLIAPTADGGVILVGRHNPKDTDIQFDVWVMKLNSFGSMSWQTTLAGNRDEMVRGLLPLSDGSFLLWGDTYSFSDGLTDIWIARLRANGGVAWQKVITTADYDAVDAAVEMPDGGFVLAGTSGLSHSSSSPGVTSWAARLDSSGVLRWEKVYGYQLSPDKAQRFVMALPAGQGDLLLAGISEQHSPDGSNDIWLVRLPDTGSPGNLLAQQDGRLFVTSTIGARSNQEDRSVYPYGPSTPEFLEGVLSQKSYFPVAICLSDVGDIGAPIPTAAPEPTPPPELTRSLYLTTPMMEGADVLALQNRLLELGYNEVGEPDGYFGRMTDEAVRRFQELNDLEVDGVIGPVSWEVLFRLDAIRDIN